MNKLLLTFLLLLMSGCSDRITRTDHVVTDSIIYWQGEELTNESP